jgi:hypothetical protein
MKESSVKHIQVLQNQSDTYHDTKTHYLMEKDLLLLQDQAGGMDVVVVDRWVALKKRWGPHGYSSSRLALGTPCLGPVDLDT